MAIKRERRARRGAKLTPTQKTDIAMGIVGAHAGRRQYQLESLFMAEVPCARRTASRYVSRAREAMRAARDAQLGDLASSLAERYADALVRAQRAEDRRTEARLLRGAVQLAVGDKVRIEDAEQLSNMPEEIRYVTFDPYEENRAREIEELKKLKAESTPEQLAELQRRLDEMGPVRPPADTYTQGQAREP